MNYTYLNTAKYTCLLLLVLALVASCKKDNYLTGGSKINPKVEMTTYDYLKSKPLFDTLVQLIDHAGMKDEINGKVTFFAPTDYSIRSLLLKRTTEVQLKYNDENIKYTIDSFPVNELKDSLRAYMFKEVISRENLSLSNQLYKNMVGEEFAIKLVESIDYDDIISQRPRFLHIIKIIDGLDPDPRPQDYPKEMWDKDEEVQTSGIITQTGLLHVINNQHAFYWR